MPENVSINLNIEAMRQVARQQFFAENTKRRTIQELIRASVPYWIAIVALALLALSAPHTAQMFDKITPGFGWAGIFLCEFGLLYIAFRRKTEHQNGGKLPYVIWGLEALLFVTAILVNGAGALIAVVSYTGNETLSAQQLLEKISTLNVVSQTSLLLVPLAALIIPIGTIVAGEGFAAVVLQGRKDQDDLEQSWKQVEQINVRSLVYSRLLDAGLNARDAGRKATSMTSNLLDKSSKTDGNTDDERTPKRTPRKAGSVKRRADARLAVRQLFVEVPDSVNWSVRQIANATGISKTIAAEERAAKRTELGLDPEDTQPLENENIEEQI